MQAGTFGSQQTAVRTRADDVQAGLTYARRSTSLVVAAGSSFIPLGGRTFARFTANASWRAEMGRAWTGTLRYERSLRFVEALAYPFFSDALSAGVNGQPFKRLGLGVSGGYSAGTVGVAAEGGSYGTYTGSAQMTTTVSRHYALYSEYVYYHYRFDERAFASTLPARLDRHTFRTGLKIWLPILN
jgi:hypothetical protein